MKLKTIARTAGAKSETNRLRRDGFIPVVLYVRGKKGEALAVKNSEFIAFLRQIKQADFRNYQHVWDDCFT